MIDGLENPSSQKGRNFKFKDGEMPRSGHKDHSQSQVTHLLKKQIMAIAQYYLGWEIAMFT
ncbi:MAG: hypothetical protein CM1200mP3_04530 [Chloroflexota bacterium]|nr:MAG: hypothetical protein CM1200mP3_04530 [Chloroflexota bacterium]